MGQPIDLASRFLNAFPFVRPDGLVVVGKFDGQFLLGSGPEEHSPGVSQIGDVALVALDEDRNGTGARARIVDPTALQLLLSVLKHLRQVALHVLFGLQLGQVSLVRTFL